jgi:hypothetical protein
MRGNARKTVDPAHGTSIALPRSFPFLEVLVTTASSTRIGTLVLRMQGAFLDTPGLTLTTREAERRFDVDDVTCQAVLGVLVDAGVLAKTRNGVFTRYYPRPELAASLGKFYAA